MHNQYEVSPPVAIDITRTQITGLDQVVDVAERLALEDLERKGSFESRLWSVSNDFDKVFGDVRDREIRPTIGVEIAGGKVRAAGPRSGWTRS